MHSILEPSNSELNLPVEGEAQVGNEQQPLRVLRACTVQQEGFWQPDIALAKNTQHHNCMCIHMLLSNSMETPPLNT